MKTGTPLTIGAALGGVAGKMMFQFLSDLSSNKDKVGAIQESVFLLLLGTISLYIKERIK